MTEQNKAKLNIKGYKVICKERHGRKGGGVGIYVHDNMYYKEMSKINESHYTTFEHVSVYQK